MASTFVKQEFTAECDIPVKTEPEENVPLEEGEEKLQEFVTARGYNITPCSNCVKLSVKPKRVEDDDGSSDSDGWSSFTRSEEQKLMWKNEVIMREVAKKKRKIPCKKEVTSQEKRIEKIKMVPIERRKERREIERTSKTPEVKQSLKAPEEIEGIKKKMEEKRRVNRKKRSMDMASKDIEMDRRENGEISISPEIASPRKNKKVSKSVKNLSEEDKARIQEERRIKRYMYKQARLSSMTEEEKKKEAEKRRQHSQTHRKKMTEDDKKKKRERDYFRKQALLAQMTEEEREEYKRRNTEAARKWRENLTGEKLERYLEYMRNKTKVYLKRPEYKASENYERFKQYVRYRTANETQEERQKRLRRYKINQAVRKLKKELEKAGITQEEIEEKAKELKERMEAEPLPAPEQISTYKPRVQARKPKGVGDVGVTGEHRQGEEATSTEFVYKRKPRKRNKEDSIVPVPSPVPVTVPPPPTIICVPVPINEPYKSEIIFESITFETIVPSVQASSSSVITLNNGEVNFEFIGADDDRFDDSHNMQVQEPKTVTMTVAPEEVQPVPVPVHIPASSFSIPEVVKCPHCASCFLQRSQLLNHISSEHSSLSWKCPVCRVIVLSPVELQEHFKSEHASSCEKKEASVSGLPKNNVVTKLEQKSPTKPSSDAFSCIKCDPLAPDSTKTFEKQTDLMEHVKSSHPEFYWPCRKCNILKYSDKSLRIHFKMCQKSSRS